MADNNTQETISEKSMLELGDLMKKYEEVTTSGYLVPNCPVYARIDGRAFHTFCRGMRKPFDPEMLRTMQETCAYLVKETQAAIGYVQSDEISLAWESSKHAPFDGRLQKLSSVLAGMASAKFNQVIFLTGGDSMMGRAIKHIPHFDCRVCNIPTKDELELMFKWREMDSYRNAVNSVAQANFSHRELQGKTIPEVHEMLFQKGINFTKDFSPNERHGTFLMRVNKQVKIPEEILDKMPPNQKPDDGMCIRTFVEDMNVTSFAGLHSLIDAMFGVTPMPQI